MKLKFESPSGYLPRASGLLQSLPSASAFHERLSLRPPGGQYSVSLHRVVEAFHAVLDRVEPTVFTAFEAPGSARAARSLNNAVTDLLYALFEHVETCHTILKCLFGSDKLYGSNPQVKLFKRSVHAYRDLIAVPVNRMKHNQRCISSCTFDWPGGVVPGYYVEGVDDKGVIGPDPQVHPDNTAFSLTRDLPLHFVNIHIVSHHLSEAVKAITGSTPAALTALPEKSSSTWLSLGTRLAKLPRVTFPDEILKPFPLVALRQPPDRTTPILTIEYPSSVVVSSVPKGARVTSATMGDGVSRSFRFPYLKG